MRFVPFLSLVHLLGLCCAKTMTKRTIDRSDQTRGQHDDDEDRGVLSGFRLLFIFVFCATVARGEQDDDGGGGCGVFVREEEEEREGVYATWKIEG